MILGNKQTEECSHCFDLPKTNTPEDYFKVAEKCIELVKNGHARVTEQNCPIEELMYQLDHEQKYTFHHSVRCSCGTTYKFAACIRSTVTILEKIKQKKKRT